jgi:hypothetical protein
VLLSGVAVEKLVAPKFAKIKSPQDELQTTFSVFLDIFYPQNLAVWDEKGVFQQPQAISRFDCWSMSCNRDLAPVICGHAAIVFAYVRV